MSTNHNLFEEKGEPKRYRTEVLSSVYEPNALPLGQTGSLSHILLLSFILHPDDLWFDTATRCQWLAKRHFLEEGCRKSVRIVCLLCFIDEKQTNNNNNNNKNQTNKQFRVQSVMLLYVCRQRPYRLLTWSPG